MTTSHVTRFGRQAWKTTFIVDSIGDDFIGYHTHYSLGPRLERGIRQIAFDTHSVDLCIHRQFFYGRLANDAEIRNMASCGIIPVEEVHDWNEEEVSIFALGYCPRRQVIQDGSKSGSLEVDNIYEQNFPLEFDDEKQCPVCQEEKCVSPNCLLCLPCRHTLCKFCFQKLSSGGKVVKCPKCRYTVDKALIKTKKI